MLVLFTVDTTDNELREKIRAQVKERTGEDCLVLGPAFTGVAHFETAKDKERAAPPKKRLPWPFTSRNRRNPTRH